MGRIEKRFPKPFEQPFADAVAVTPIMTGRGAVLTVAGRLLAATTTATVVTLS
jgi:hypothetical protein